MRVVLLGGAPGIGKTTTARRLMEFAQAGPDLVQWVDVDALWFHRPWRVDERTKAMVHANIRAVADQAAQAGVDVLLITWVFHTADLHRVVAGLLPPGSEVTSVQLHAGHEVWTRRYTGDPERGGAPLAHHEEGYTGTHAVPVDHVVKTDGLTPIEVADAVALAIGGALVHRVDQGASLAQTGAITRLAGPDSWVTPWAEPHSSGLSRGRTTVRVATSPWPRPLVTVPTETMVVVPSAARVTVVAGKLMVLDPLGEFQVQVSVLLGSLTELRQLALWLMVSEPLPEVTEPSGPQE